jgi:hypothetical protein
VRFSSPSSGSSQVASPCAEAHTCSIGGTLFVQREAFKGILVPLVGGVLEKTRRGFEQMNAALKQRAET